VCHAGCSPATTVALWASDNAQINETDRCGICMTSSIYTAAILYWCERFGEIGDCRWVTRWCSHLLESLLSHPPSLASRESWFTWIREHIACLDPRRHMTGQSETSYAWLYLTYFYTTINHCWSHKQYIQYHMPVPWAYLTLGFIERSDVLIKI